MYINPGYELVGCVECVQIKFNYKVEEFEKLPHAFEEFKVDDSVPIVVNVEDWSIKNGFLKVSSE